MIKVKIANNVKRTEVNIAGTTAILDSGEQRDFGHEVTLRDALEAAGVDYTHGTTTLDGSPLGVGDLDKSFASFGIREKCFLYNVVKADNA